MSKPNWTPRLSDVLKHKTVEIKAHSNRTGNDYITDVIQTLRVVSTGSKEKMNDDFFKYSIVDITTGLEYEIKVQRNIDVNFGFPLEFRNVRGGATSKGGWYSADDVVLIKKSA